MKKILAFICVFAVVFLFFGAYVSSAQSVLAEPTKTGTWHGLVNCGFAVDGKITVPCTFEKFMEMLQYAMKYLIWVISLIMVGLIAWSLS